MLRFPDGMRDRLKAVAAANKRSLNAEVIARLEESLDREETAFGIDRISEGSGETPLDKDMSEAIGKAIRDVLKAHGLKPTIVNDSGEMEEL